MYITLADIKKAMAEATLIQLSNDDPTATTVDLEVVEEVITNACELVDGYLHGRYTLPLVPVPTVINGLCVDLAKHSLYKRRPEGNNIPDMVIDGYKNAIKLLESIQIGKLHLGVKGLPEIQPDSGEFKVKAAPKMNLEGY